MSIEVVCPKGHTLKVKDRFAGQSGLCPHCKSRVEVPHHLTDESVLDIVGDYQPPSAAAKPQWEEEEEVESASVIDDAPSSTAVTESSGLSLLGSSIIRHHKVCPHCREMVKLWYASCPKCGKYFDD